jgi:hypothetical protein
MRSRGPGAIVAAAAIAALVPAHRATAADPPAPKLPYSDDVEPPPALPLPLDRAFKGQLVAFDGDRVTLRWDWKSAEQLADFESFIPVRATLEGGFAAKDGHLAASGTAGLRLRLALGDVEMHVPAKLTNPHDLGIALVAPGAAEDSVLCLVQDVLFTRFDGPAGNCNMINRLGGVASASSGMKEFRYIARNPYPRIANGQEVQFDVARKGLDTSFTISVKGGDSATLQGRDNGTPLPRVTPSLYVSGGAAEFGELTISGSVDKAWCADHGVLPYVSSDLLDSGNRWKAAEKKAAELVERFARPDRAADKAAKNGVAADAIAPFVGDVKLPLVIRIRAAEALVDRGSADGAVADRIASLLDAKDLPARVLAWQVLRARLPWHFRYSVNADAAVRRDAAAAIGAYLRERADATAKGQVFVDGKWCTPDGADGVRSEWEHAWELRTPRIRLRTDLTRKDADRCLAALEAEYRELVRLVGREPPAQCLPLSVLVFKDKPDFAAFCNANGYSAKAAWGRFVDLDDNVSFTAFDARDGLANTLGQFAKQYLHFATGRFWPAWFDEGRAAWFGSAEYGTSSFDGAALKVGLTAHGGSIDLLKVAASERRMPPIADLIVKDPRALSPEARRIWYAEVWALHAWFMGGAPESVRALFAQWQSGMEQRTTAPSDVDAAGQQTFLGLFERDLPEMDRLFGEWVVKL